jgi:arylsulfatase A-like enzyme
MGRKILFVTTDQQRYDALGCNGGRAARTPVVDALAARGIRFTRAHAQSVVCMPARASMITGQYVRTHGVLMNGIALPDDAPSVAAELKAKKRYRTALIGKAHFEPALDPGFTFRENRLVREPATMPVRGFDHMELTMHGPLGPWHYPAWLRAHHAGDIDGFYRVLTKELQLNHAGGGDTGACQVRHNPVPRGHYHTDWVADRVIAYLDTLAPDEDWFVWMSFPDPHHPWDPPQSERGRHDWRSTALPAGWPADADAARAILRDKPKHWLEWYEGRLVSNYEAPPAFVPAQMTADQVREINALTHAKNELIDEALGRVLAHVGKRGWSNDTDVVYTCDHGEFQGDFGLLFKGPYHVDALMRLPMIWAPAPSAGVAPALIERPVGQLDLAPTFCDIAGLPAPTWMQGQPLPTSSVEADQQKRERTLTEWDSDINGIELHLRTLYRDGLVCTTYEKGTLHDGSEGELYDLAADPLQHRNLWNDSGWRRRRDELVADLTTNLPPAGPKLKRVSPV